MTHKKLPGAPPIQVGARGILERTRLAIQFCCPHTQNLGRQRLRQQHHAQQREDRHRERNPIPSNVSISPTPNPRDQEPTHQNVHLHPTGLTNPATIGAATGPTTVAPDHNIMTLPLGPSSQNTSAITPPTTLTGGLPNVPVKNLHAKKTPQLGGASAVPSSDSVNSTKLTSSVGRRPWLSLSGANMSGPNMKPTR